MSNYTTNPMHLKKNNEGNALVGCLGILIAWVFAVLMVIGFWTGVGWSVLTLLRHFGVIG